MTTQEFSDTFDTLLASYSHKADFGDSTSYMDVSLDEFEKSIFLTLAQDLIVKSYFDRTSNSQALGIDDSARRLIDFSSLIKVATLLKASGQNSFDDRGVIYQLPKKKDLSGNDIADTTDVLFILNEKLIREVLNDDLEWVKDKEYVIIPLSYKEYDREMSRPYSEPLKKQAWRLFLNQLTKFDVNAEIIPKFDIKEGDTSRFVYKLRYVKRPQPIILEDLPNNLSIDGISTTSECELNPILHIDILNEAVRLALNSKGIETRDLKAAREAARSNRS